MLQPGALIKGFRFQRHVLCMDCLVTPELLISAHGVIFKVDVCSLVFLCPMSILQCDEIQKETQRAVKGKNSATLPHRLLSSCLMLLPHKHVFFLQKSQKKPK